MTSTDPSASAWPQGRWYALHRGDAPLDDGAAQLHVVEAGELVLPHGRVGACDPFVGLEDCPVWAEVQPGRYPVRITVADVSPELDGSHLREAYATLVLDPAATEVSRRVLGDAQPGRFEGIPVDAGTACFVDAAAVTAGMPDPGTWHDALFETSGGWFERMDDPEHIAAGIANIALPQATDGANVVVVHSGWGDGIYPVIGGYDADGRLVRVHLDFFVVGGPEPEPGTTARRSPARRPSSLVALAILMSALAAWLAIGLSLQADAGFVAIGGLVVAFATTGILAWRGLLPR